MSICMNMSLNSCDLCIVCSKSVKYCLRNFCCKMCNGFVHKKCSKLEPKQLKSLKVNEWVCQNCSVQRDPNSDIENLNKSPKFNTDSKTNDVSENSKCIVCLKTIKNCHKDISCKACKGYVHKKCTKLKQKQLKSLKRGEWSCSKCYKDVNLDNTTSIEDDVCKLNDSPQFSITDIDFKKYDNMIFNPLRFDSNNTEKTYNDIVNSNNGGIHECSYLTPEQFCTDPNANRGNFNLLNVNTRSLAKNFG